MIILVDAMGGDNAPNEIVCGCMDAINEHEGYDIHLIGDYERIKQILNDRKFNNSRLKVLHASEVITSDDIPTKAIRSKKDSSMVIGFKLLKEGKGDVFVSAGNTGALLAGALFILGRIKGVDRPALAPVIPTKTGGALLIDGGANAVCKPINYLQFGVMGSIYVKEVFKIENPKVGLVNVGSEENKGTEQIRQAYGLLSNASINFSGNLESQQILAGKANVIVCDGFVGNILLKFLEGAGTFFFDEIKQVYKENIFTKLSSLIVKKGFRKFKKRLDPSEFGGAPFLGVNGKVIKAHGSSNAKAIKNAVIKANIFAKSSLVEQLREEFKNMEVEGLEQ